MRKLSTEKRAAVLHALVEGNSINATCRMCGVAKLTVLRLLADVGQFCQDYHDLTVRGLSSKRLQLDEVWSFVGCKQANKERGKQGDGDVWTWTALDADSKRSSSPASWGSARHGAPGSLWETWPTVWRTGSR